MEWRPQKWVGRYRYDAYLPQHRCLIEIDGNFWHALPAQQRNDARKTAYAQSRGYVLARVWADEFARDPDGWVARLMRGLARVGGSGESP